LFLGQKDAPNPVEIFFFRQRLFSGQKQSNYSEGPYLAFQTLALSVLPSLS